jgi:molecular chaperone GrpE
MVLDSSSGSENMFDSDRTKDTTEDTSVGESQAEISSESSTPSALEVECADLKDRLLRTMAEIENTRRRAARDVMDARQYAIAAFARDTLTAADNIQRALACLGEGEKEKLSTPLKAFVEGIELTERDFLTVLERHGVKKLDPHGQKFDPHFHQAMFEVEDSSVPVGTVAQVIQIGFVIGERVLRPALVGVSKGGPKAEAAPTDESLDQDTTADSLHKAS